MHSASARLIVPARVPIAGRLSHVAYGDFGSEALRSIIETALTRDPYMRMHLLATNKMAFIWAEQLGLSAADRELFCRAALLHDVGKILIPDAIIGKPSALTADEYRLVQTHAELGERLVKTEEGFDEVALIVGQHHEWYNGEGYPRGLKGEEIHPLGRALSVIDAFSAMTDMRPYSSRRTTEDALAELETWSGRQFDPFYVESFAQMKRGRGEHGSLPA